MTDHDLFARLIDATSAVERSRLQLPGQIETLEEVEGWQRNRRPTASSMTGAWVRCDRDGSWWLWPVGTPWGTWVRVIRNLDGSMPLCCVPLYPRATMASR